MADDDYEGGPASASTALLNARRIARGMPKRGMTPNIDNFSDAMGATNRLRRELEEKGLKGFKKGGKVKKTGVYKLHAGEKVVTAKKAAQEARDKKLLQKTRYR